LRERAPDEINRDSLLKGGLDSKAVIEQRFSANLVRRRKQSSVGKRFRFDGHSHFKLRERK
jgi:hypothetical protein